MKPLSRNGDSHSTDTTPCRYFPICKSTWTSNICSFAFLGDISNICKKASRTILCQISLCESPSGHGKGFSWWREIAPHKTCPRRSKTLSPEKGEENCKLRETFLVCTIRTLSHLFHPPSLLFKWLDSLHWISRNNWSTPSDNILLGGSLANPATSFRL